PWISRSMPSICSRTDERSACLAGTLAGTRRAAFFVPFFAAFFAGLSLMAVLPVAPLEITHEIGQCLHAFHRHGVVDRRAHAAEHAMALERDQPGLAGLVEERRVQRIVVQEEWHVHARARRRIHVVAVEAAGAVDGVVEQLRLSFALAREFFHPA